MIDLISIALVIGICVVLWIGQRRNRETEKRTAAKSIVYKDSYIIPNRGTAFVLDLKENNLPSERAHFTSELMGKNVVIDGKVKRVKGIEAYATPEGYQHSKISILV